MPIEPMVHWLSLNNRTLILPVSLARYCQDPSRFCPHSSGWLGMVGERQSLPPPPINNACSPPARETLWLLLCQTSQCSRKGGTVHGKSIATCQCSQIFQVSGARLCSSSRHADRLRLHATSLLELFGGQLHRRLRGDRCAVRSCRGPGAKTRNVLRWNPKSGCQRLFCIQLECTEVLAAIPTITVQDIARLPPPPLRMPCCRPALCC